MDSNVFQRDFKAALKTDLIKMLDANSFLSQLTTARDRNTAVDADE